LKQTIKELKLLDQDDNYQSMKTDTLSQGYGQKRIGAGWISIDLGISEDDVT